MLILGFILKNKMDAVYQLKKEDKEKFIYTFSNAFVPNKALLGSIEDPKRRLACYNAFFNVEFERFLINSISIADSPECNSIILYGEKQKIDACEASIFTYFKDFLFLKLKGEITFSEIFKLKTYLDNYYNFLQSIKLDDIENYYTIEYFATKPEMQGKGVGSKVMRFILSKADKENKKCYLECEEKNRKLYEHYGFKVIAQTKILEDVNYYALVREPFSQKIE